MPIAKIPLPLGVFHPRSSKRFTSRCASILFFNEISNKDPYMRMNLSVYLTIATLLASTVSSGPTSLVEISKRSSIFENSQNSRYNEKNREERESEQTELRNIENVENSWKESSLEELADATGSKGYVMGSSEGGKYANERENNGQSIDAVPGKPGMDYPNHERIPITSFTCMDKEPGGYYADPETGCQVFHVCNTGGVKSSFICPPGSIFDQRYFVCDWWYGFNCDEAIDLYQRKIQENSKSSSKEVTENVEKRTNNDLPDGKSANGKSSRDFPNNVHSYSSNWMRDRKNYENLPRGFSRDRDESLINLTNDLASYVNWIE